MHIASIASYKLHTSFGVVCATRKVVVSTKQLKMALRWSRWSLRSPSHQDSWVGWFANKDDCCVPTMLRDSVQTFPWSQPKHIDIIDIQEASWRRNWLLLQGLHKIVLWTQMITGVGILDLRPLYPLASSYLYLRDVSSRRQFLLRKVLGSHFDAFCHILPLASPGGCLCIQPQGTAFSEFFRPFQVVIDDRG